jgi:hypothetical protein
VRERERLRIYVWGDCEGTRAEELKAWKELSVAMGMKGSHSTRKFQNPIFLFFRLKDLSLFGLGLTDTGNGTTEHIFMLVKQKILGLVWYIFSFWVFNS